MLIQHSEPLERLLRRGLTERLNEGQDHRCDNHCPAHESNVDVNGFHGRDGGYRSDGLGLRSDAEVGLFLSNRSSGFRVLGKHSQHPIGREL